MKLETERLILREWQLTDIPDMVEGLNDFYTAKNLTIPFTFLPGTTIPTNTPLGNDNRKSIIRPRHLPSVTLITSRFFNSL